MFMPDSSITIILQKLREAVSEEERDAAAAALYRCYRGQVERLARGRLTSGGGLADEEDVAQSAFRSFFGRIESGQLDALVTGGQAWAILAKLTRNKAIDSVRYDNAICRGGDGGRRSTDPRDAAPLESPGSRDASGSRVRSSTRATDSGRLRPEAGPPGRNRLNLGDHAATRSRCGDSLRSRSAGRREDYPLDAVRDRNQRSGEEQAASNEVIEHFLEQLSEATLRGIVSLKLHGFTNEEIAQKLGCATRTIERKLNLIRRLWIPILESGDEERQT
jgi:RNA polymerase sigma factor (sigma-70 family)